MKISRGRPTFMTSLNKYLLVPVLLNGSGNLFQCTQQLIYTVVLSSQTSIIAALYGMLQSRNKLASEKVHQNAVFAHLSLHKHITRPESSLSISLNTSTCFAVMQRRRRVLRKSNQTNKQEKRKQTKIKTKKKQLKFCFRPELNWRPSACQADVITTTLRKPL